MVEILDISEGLIFALKPAGVSSQEAEGSAMPELLRKQLNTDYIAVLHRLDTAVSGVMVYASEKSAAADISAKIQNGELKKEYFAIVAGVPTAPSGELCDLLFKDSRANKSYVVRRQRTGVREARLIYTLIETVELDNGKISLVKIELITGRSHQIRVQFSHRKMPLLGDRKYGSRFNCPIALFSHRITLTLPSGEKKSVAALPDRGAFPWNKFTNY